MTNQYQIWSSTINPDEDDNPLFSPINSRRYNFQAALLEQTLEENNVFGKIVEINAKKYFTVHYLELQIDSKVEDVINYKETLKLVLTTPYLYIVYPIPTTTHIGIEIPNFYPSDIYLSNGIEYLKELDFLFIKAFTIIVSHQRVDLKIFNSEMDIKKDVLMELLRDMEDVGIFKKEGKKNIVLVQDISLCGKYWKAWKDMDRMR